MGGRQAVRKGRWKLVHLNVRSDEDRYELYDLDNDPSESRDVLADAPSVAEDLKSIMSASHVPNPDFSLLKGE